MAVNIGPKIGIDGEAEYRNAIKNIIQQARTLDSEMKAVTAAFDENTDEEEKNREVSRILTQQLEVQKQRVSELNKMLEKSIEVHGESATETLKWKEAVNGAKVQVSNFENELKKLNSELKETANELDESEKSALSFVDVFKANILSIVATKGIGMVTDAVRDLARELKNFAIDGLETASNLQEVQNVIDTTFGNAGAKAIDGFASKAAISFGISELSAKKFTGTLGAMFKSMQIGEGATLKMSQELTALAGDMASFYNIDAEEAFNKLRSGISGETEPLKQLGINMSVANLEAYALSQGIETSYRAMTQAEQATLRYKYIMEATADAQGDFARTGSSYANQQKKLKLNIENLGATIGNALLPIVTEFTTALNGLLSGQIKLESFITNISLTAVQIGRSVINNIVSGIQQFLPLFIEQVPVLIGGFVQTLTENFPQIVETGMEVLAQLVAGIISNVGLLIAQAPLLFAEFAAAMRDMDWLGIGVNIVKGIINGVLSMAKALMDTFIELAKNSFQAVKNYFGIASPSKLMANEIGQYLPAGITVGIDKAMPKTISSFQKQMEKLTAIPLKMQMPYMNTMYPMRTGNTNNISITVQTSSEADGYQIADIINRRLGELLV